MSMSFGEPIGQGWLQIGELALAFALSALIGLEREFRQKSAGLRTHTLVGVASALIMLVSKYGFTDVLENGRVVVDPSRVAAQIVSGIGFIGGGLIFVRRDSVRGLTTAAIVWLTASVGMACGAGLPILAIAVVIGHFIVVFTFPNLAGLLPKSRWTPSILEVSYEDGREVLRDVLVASTKQGFAISRLRYERSPRESELGDFARGDPIGGTDWQNNKARSDFVDSTTQGKQNATVILEVQGTGSVSKLAAKLADLDGVISVHAGDGNVLSE
jgi:putative Mg2+ transporter-C (MgtC) family protein